MIKQNSCNKPFLSIVISAFSVTGTLLPVYDVSCIFVGFISGFLFIHLFYLFYLFIFFFCKITLVKCLRLYSCQVSMGLLDLVVLDLLYTVCH